MTDKIKRKLSSPHPPLPPGDQVKSGKQVNVIHKENPYSSDSENETSETNLPEETSVSSDGSEQLKYFDLLSSSSEE